MGKTKTAFVAEPGADSKTSEERYREKKEKQAAKEASGKKEKVHIAGLKGGQRIKMIGEEIPQAESEIEKAGEQEGPASAKASARQGNKVERVRGKNYQEAKKKIKPGEAYPVADAIKLVKETTYSKFDATFEAHLMLKKIGISLNVTLPFSAGKAKKIEFATDATIKKLTSGKIDFDILLATADMMPKLVVFAKVLGPKGLMPNPKNGTLVKSAKDAEKFGGNSVSLRSEREAPLLHTTFGKVSQKDTELKENLETILKAVGGSKQIVKGYIKSSMSPAVRISI